MIAPTEQEQIPSELLATLSDLERWAQRALLDTRLDKVKLWALKTPAIAASALAGVFGHYGLTSMSLFVAALSSACILIDGFNPRGLLLKAHLSALHDIRNLANRGVCEECRDDASRVEFA